MNKRIIFVKDLNSTETPVDPNDFNLPTVNLVKDFQDSVTSIFRFNGLRSIFSTEEGTITIWKKWGLEITLTSEELGGRDCLTLEIDAEDKSAEVSTQVVAESWICLKADGYECFNPREVEQFFRRE